MIGIHLMLLAVAVAVVAPRLLTGAGWAYRSPRLGIAAWYAVLLAVASAAGGAVLSWLAPWRLSNAPVCVAWRWLAHAAAGGHGLAGHVVFWAAVAVLSVLAARIAVAAGRGWRAGARRRHTQVQTLDLAGYRRADLGATVVEHAQPAAYMVAGRARRIVVTTGALERLAPDELAAVLAHERAHAAGRHDLIIDVIRLAGRAFPRSGLLVAARSELSRLVEMRADDVAVSVHPRLSLARALVAMTAPTAAPVAAGAVAVLAATGGDALARMNRLLDPPAPLRRWHRWALAGVLAALGVAPVGLLVAAQFLPVLSMCPTL